MPDPTDNSTPSTLPDPELNPLLNPLLAANMGRWAEVYFTTPPEKRSTAVAELIRELEAGPTMQSAPETPQHPSEVERDEAGRAFDTSKEARSPEMLNGEEPGAICRECGYRSPEEQKFCGMCGAPLFLFAEEQTSEPSTEVPATVPDFQASRSWSESEPAVMPDVDYGNRVLQHDRFDIGSHEHFYDANPSQPSAQMEIPHFAMEAPTVPYRYRLYIGVVLALLLTVLLYMAWRGTAALSGVQQSPPSRIMPAAPTAGPANEPPVSKGAAAPPARDVIPVDAAPASKKADNSVPPQHKAEKPLDRPLQNAKSADVNTPEKPPERPARRMVPSAAPTSALALEQSSAQDFATAEKYLYGTQGTARNSQEASQWLWKAVGKGNPTASIALSDLYLRGDGVPKNCDQARLLLDAAARKGARGAGERLRNLQAFGCR